MGKEERALRYGIHTAHSHAGNPLRRPPDSNGPKCVNELHIKTHGAGTSGLEPLLMLILCSECGHRLRAGMGSVGAFGMVEFFDDRAQSDTQGKQVMHCPGWVCGSITASASS